MSTTAKYVLGTPATLLSTELNALADATGVLTSTAYNNTQAGGGGDGYTGCDVELFINSLASAPTTAGVSVTVWFLETQDGTNYEDGDASTTPSRLPDVVFPVRLVSTAQRIIRRVLLPAGNFKTLLKNETTKAFGASGHTLKIRPNTSQGV